MSHIETFGHECPSEKFPWATGTFLVRLVDGQEIVMVWSENNIPVPQAWKDLPRVNFTPDCTLSWAWNELKEASYILLGKGASAIAVHSEPEISRRLGREYIKTSQRKVCSLGELTRVLGQAGYLDHDDDYLWKLNSLPEDDHYHALTEYLQALPYESTIVWSSPYWSMDRPYHQGPWVEIQISPFCEQAGANWAFLVGTQAERMNDYHHPRIMISLPMTPHADPVLSKCSEKPGREWVYLPRQINSQLKAWATTHLGRADLVWRWMPEDIPLREKNIHQALYQTMQVEDKHSVSLSSDELRELGAFEPFSTPDFD